MSSVFIERIINKNLLIFLLLLHVFHNLHAVFSYHNLDLLICFVKVDWLVVGFKANCPLVVPGPIGEMPSVGIFLRDFSPYLCEFR